MRLLPEPVTAHAITRQVGRYLYQLIMAKRNLLTDTIKTKPVFPLLLPVFFVLHEFTANYDNVPVTGSLGLCLLYILTSCIIAGLAWLFFRNLQKAALMALLMMAWNFFYGSIKDTLHQQFPESILHQYRFIIPFGILLFVIALIWLKKRKAPLNKLTSYLNILLLALITYDVISLLTKANNNLQSPLAKTLTTCDTCSKPDIFLIIADGYTSNNSLNTQFGFDNVSFENALHQRGFHIVPNSTSNYNFTLYSMASILNMDYFTNEEHEQPVRVRQTYNQVRKNIVTKYLAKSGYRFYNCSIFDVADQPAQDYSYFIPTGIKIITSQTFINRFIKDFEPDLLAGRFGGSLQKKFA